MTTTNPAHDLARMMDRLSYLIAGLVQRGNSAGFRVPELDADPPVDDLTNVWLLSDGRLRSRTSDGVIHQYAPGSTGSSTSGTTKPTEANPTRHTREYEATWMRQFCAVHGLEHDWDLADADSHDAAHYGTVSAVHGERRLMFGFDDATMRADLTGEIIRKVEIRAGNTDAPNKTVELHFGWHNSARSGSDFHQVRRDAYVSHWPRVGFAGTKVGGWRPASAGIGTAFRDSRARGLTIDQPAGRSYAGSLNWASVALRITSTG